MLTDEQNKAIKILKPRILNNEPITILQGYGGTGKALVHGTKIPTMEGHVLIENIQIGDYVVDRQGQQTQVTGVYPQGITKNYKITFQDGRTSKCSSEHLWVVYTSKGYLKNFTTQEMFEKGTVNGFTFKIPINQTIDYPAKELLISPYAMGVFIGDGRGLKPDLTINSKNSKITLEFAESISANFCEEHMVSDSWCFIKNGGKIHTKSFFTNYPELLTYSCCKSIPKDYLFNSKENRLALLQGLMDVKGKVQQKTHCRFITTSEPLKNDFLFLIRSLGFIGTVKIKKRPTGNHYVIHFSASEGEIANFFRVNKPKQRTQTADKTNSQPKLLITNIQPIEDDYSTCISVDNAEKLFLTEDFIVTHNTYTLTYLLQELNYSSREVKFCAFTGAAAKILMNRGLNASTIHSLIYKPIMRYGVCVGFRKKTTTEMGAEEIKLIVVDEYSMVSQELLDDLGSFHIPLLLVGDNAQLPPIGVPNKYINDFHAQLTQVQRQALDSAVLWAATEVREGRFLKEGVYGNGELFVGRKHQLNQDWLRPDVQIICGTNATREKLNIQVAGHVAPEKGDKIVFLKNHFDLGIVNGSVVNLTGFTKAIAYDKLKFMIDDMPVNEYNAYFQVAPKKFPKHVHNVYDFAYALTCHKMQGSGVSESLLIVDESFYFREHQTAWLYTALTRSTGEKPVALLR